MASLDRMTDALGPDSLVVSHDAAGFGLTERYQQPMPFVQIYASSHLSPLVYHGPDGKQLTYYSLCLGSLRRPSGLKKYRVAHNARVGRTLLDLEISDTLSVEDGGKIPKWRRLYMGHSMGGW
eukprot:4932945-Pyramimonas_sp.AAC.1